MYDHGFSCCVCAMKNIYFCSRNHKHTRTNPHKHSPNTWMNKQTALRICMHENNYNCSKVFRNICYVPRSVRGKQAYAPKANAFTHFSKYLKEYIIILRMPLIDKGRRENPFLFSLFSLHFFLFSPFFLFFFFISFPFSAPCISSWMPSRIWYFKKISNTKKSKHRVGGGKQRRNARSRLQHQCHPNQFE